MKKRRRKMWIAILLCVVLLLPLFMQDREPVVYAGEAIPNEGTLTLSNGKDSNEWYTGPFGYRTSHFKVNVNGETKDAYCIDPSADTPPSSSYGYYIHDGGTAGSATYAAATVLYQFEYHFNDVNTMWEDVMNEAGVPDADRNRFDFNDYGNVYFLIHSLLANCWHSGEVWDAGESGGAYEISGHSEFKNAFNGLYTKLLLAGHPTGYQVYYVDTGSDYQNVVFADYQPCGKIIVNKQSQSIAIHNMHPDSYSLEGAEYGIYTSREDAQNGQNCLMTIVIHNGSASSGEIPTGTYYVKETKASAGYRLNPEITETVVLPETETTVTSIENLEHAKVSLKKSSSNTECTNLSSLYSLAGAKYRLYRDSLCSEHAEAMVINDKGDITGTADAVLVTDENGDSKTLYLAKDIYYVKELQASPGYLCNPEVQIVDLRQAEDESTYVIEAKEVPVMAAPKLIVQKKDSEGISSKQIHENEEKNSRSASATLEGAVFAFSYYDQYYQSKELLPAAPKAVWYVQTLYDERTQNYEAYLDEAHLAAGYTSSPFFYDESSQIALPLGTLTVTEVQEPRGYLMPGKGGTVQIQSGVVTDGVVMTQIISMDEDADGSSDRADMYIKAAVGQNVSYQILQENIPIIVSEEVQRGDFRFVKTEHKSGRELDNIFFRITASSGESHIICTRNGGFYSSAETAHSHNTNAWDKYYDKNGKYVGPTDPNELERQLDILGNCGLWFYGTADTNAWDVRNIRDDKGALRYGKDEYLLEELPGPNNTDKQLIKRVFSIQEDQSNVWLGNITNVEIPQIRTMEWDAYSKNHTSAVSGDFTSRIMDTVSYEYLPAETTYTVKGILMELNADGTADTPLCTQDGEMIQAYTVFQTPASVYSGIPYVSGSVDVEYEFSSNNLAGKRFVIYEYLYEGEDTDPLVIEENEIVTDDVCVIQGVRLMHADAKDPDQRGGFLAIHTQASDSESGKEIGVLSEAVRVSDRIDYDSLTPGYEYKICGELVYQRNDTGEILPILQKNGQPLTVTKHFVPESESGELAVDFDAFDGGQLVDENGDLICDGVVVYETLYWNNQVIAAHKDIADSQQTIRFLRQGRVRVQKTADCVTGAEKEEIQLPNGETVELYHLQREPSNYAGVTFSVYDAETDAVVTTFVTDENGIGISGILLYGDGRRYYVQETGVDSEYCISAEKYPIDFSDYSAQEVCEYTETIKVHNQANTVCISLHKQEEVMEPHEDGGFTFLNRDAQNVWYGIYNCEDIETNTSGVGIPKDSLLLIMETDEQGIADVEYALPEGSYYCRELCTSGDEYQLDERKYPFEVSYKEKASDIYRITIEGNPELLNLYKSQPVELHKIDDYNEPIANVEFALYRQYGEEYRLVGTYITDEKGKIRIDRVPYGNYYFIEIKGVAGYVFDGVTKYDFVIPADPFCLTAALVGISKYGKQDETTSHNYSYETIDGTGMPEGVQLTAVNRRSIKPEIMDIPTYTKIPDTPEVKEEPTEVPAPENPISPATGDHSALFLWWGLVISFSVGLIYVLIVRRNRFGRKSLKKSHKNIRSW